jgi:hypothetical protein
MSNTSLRLFHPLNDVLACCLCCLAVVQLQQQEELLQVPREPLCEWRGVLLLHGVHPGAAAQGGEP